MNLGKHASHIWVSAAYTRDYEKDHPAAEYRITFH
jgi:hypothetical protein